MSMIDNGYCEARVGDEERQQEAVLVGRGAAFDLPPSADSRSLGNADPDRRPEASWSVRTNRSSNSKVVFELFCPALCQAIAVAVHLQNTDMVGQPVEQCAGQAL